MQLEFKSCDACSAHPDKLCGGCRHNEQVIAALKRDLRAAQKLASPVWASEEEQEFWDRVD